MTSTPNLSEVQIYCILMYKVTRFNIDSFILIANKRINQPFTYDT
ncbi:protein of unknown function [Candidatus Nitrosocosmicus franklandus]|uniref:Uncharacterized protein n=1 Tax=Candidatus Nitrosocosmicus franklandianus TaxID=1798806 RepID=A0A484IEY2_9ARCH|nr:protein of unknown function [Candidatus Nitrosocosmicus franklandus]